MADLNQLALEWQYHNQKWMLGECKQKDYSLCSGNCQECESRVISPAEIEISDPFAFFISRPGVMRGRGKTPHFREGMKRLSHRHVTGMPTG